MKTNSWINGCEYDYVSHKIGTECIQGEYYLNRMIMTLNIAELVNRGGIHKAELTLTQTGSTVMGYVRSIGIFEEGSDELIDYEQVKPMVGDTVQYTFDILKLLDKANVENKAEVKMYIKMIPEDEVIEGHITVCGSEHGTYAPVLTISYESTQNQHESNSLWTHELGFMGQGNVHLENGKLKFVAEDFGWTGNRMPLTIQHLFDMKKMYSDSKIGAGWDLNTSARLSSTIFEYEGVEYDGFVFTKAGEETIYFKCSDKTTGNNLMPFYFLYESLTDSEMILDPIYRTIETEDSYYLFDENGFLIEMRDEYNNYNSFEYVNEKLVSATDSVGRTFSFTYNSDGYLAAITSPDGTAVTYSYTGNLLTGINWPGGKKAVIQYDSGKPAAVILKNAAAENLYKVVYEYCEGRVSKITEYGVENGAFVKGVSTAFDYSAAAKRTVVTKTEPKDTDEGEMTDTITKTVYTFDDEGNIISEYVYTEETGNTGTANNITPQSNDGGIVYNNNNLLLEHDFQTLEHWNCMPGNTEQFEVSAGEHELEVPYHKNSLKMVTGAGSVANGVYQQTEILPEGKYTFSAYVKVSADIVGDTEPGVYIRVTDLSGNVLAESEHISINTDYVRLVEDFEMMNSQAVRVQILVNGAGITFVNAPQLENNSVANYYNLLENGQFEHGATGWNMNGASVTAAEAFNMEKSLGISGELDAPKYAYQDVSVNSLKSTRETFSLSGWAKGYGLNNRERENGQEALFRLRAVLYYADEVDGEENEEEFIAGFSPYTEEWQFASVQIEKSKYREVDYVRVYCEYSYNLGEAYFDNIQFTRNDIERNLTAADFEMEFMDEENPDDSTEEDADDFEEAKDSYGNILTETLFNEAETEAIYRSFGYSGNGNDLVRETDSRGNNSTYTVDSNTSRTTQITDRCGNKTDFEYDAAGRTTKVKSKKANGTEVANVSYSYDTFDNMTGIVRGDGMKYALEYNAFHNLESIGVQGKAEKLVSYTYKDGNGRLKEVAYANGDVLKITYNRLGQVSSEKWYNAADVLTAHYKYSYDNQDNVVRSIDLLNKKEYDYLYDEDRIIRATQYDITFNEAGMVASKSISSVVGYKYDSEDRLAYKQIISSSGTEQARIYTTTEDDETKVEFLAGRFIAHSISETDELGRKKFEEFHVGMLDMYRDFTYHTGQVTAEHTVHNKVKGAATTGLVSQITLRSASEGTYKTLAYEYDKEERITKVIDSVDGIKEYTYDSLGQLLTEKVNGVVVNSMTYDNYGNILTKNGITYTYGDNAWKDKLTAYNGQPISYDAQGNPTSYLGHTLAWEKGRQLKSFDNISYTYDANGIRTSKTVNGVKHTYVLEGANILEETWGDNELIPMYDNEENVCGIIYNGEPYCFRKNLQGDIISITDFSGQEVAKYSYDAWGVCTILVDASDDYIASVNPYRYRGYYFDVETGLYYLQSRYYDPVIGRFVNGDDVECSTIESNPLYTNLYCYCCNNPVNETDYNGTVITVILKKVVIGFFKGFFKQLCIDYIEWALKNWVYGTNRSFKYSGVEEYASTIISSIASEFKISNIVGTSVGIAGILVKYFNKIVKKKMRKKDWANLVLDVAEVTITAMLKNSLKKYEKKRKRLRKARAKNPEKKIISTMIKNISIRIKYKGTSINAGIPITKQLMSTMVNVLLK